MNCRKAQELIVSGYSDNELKFFWKQAIEAHLAQCPACREFLAVFENTVITPFKDAPVKDAPDYLWYRIKEKIASQVPVKRPYLLDIFPKIPRPVLAAMVVIILVTANLLALRIINVEHNAKNSAVVLLYLDDVGAGNDVNVDFGSDIEKNFL